MNIMYYLKRNPTRIAYSGTKMKSKACPPLCNILSQTPCDTCFKVTLVARPLFTPATQNFCGCERDAFVSSEAVFVLFSDISSHLNCLVLFVKQLSMHFPQEVSN